MAAAAPILDFTDIQGDILEGLPKRYQTFVFFNITDATLFRGALKKITPLITTTAQALTDQAAIAQHKYHHGESLIKLVGTNIAFSHDGLTTLGIADTLGDIDFSAGQLSKAASLGDPLVPGSTTDPAWEPVYKQTIHGCFNITGESRATISERINQLETILTGTIKTVNTVDGAVRRGAEKGHEHFGFQDGVSQPAVTGFRLPNAGEAATEPGVILMGQPGDTVTTRPAWSKNSSFLAFRKLQQFVPEFNDFVGNNPILDPGLTPEQGSELLGARIIGRWKSGAPIERDPFADNLRDARDANRVNDFDYVTGDNPLTPQLKCPFTAHLRKMNPRAGFPGLPAVQVRRIIRQGIPYGPEVTLQEKHARRTSKDRGLLFTCYQSNLSLGFVFLQDTWANNVDFPNTGDGLDPIIGQGPNRSITGMDPENDAAKLNLPKDPFVKPLGGVYMIAPSLSALSGFPFSTTTAPPANVDSDAPAPATGAETTSPASVAAAA